MSLIEVTAVFSGNYETLFTPSGGFLECEENEKEDHWKLSKKTKNKDYFNHLTVSLTKSTQVSLVKNLEVLISRINTMWTPSVLKEKGINARALECTAENDVLKFNSKVAKLSFLSNFFPTLVVFHDVSGKEGQKRVYHSSENAYLACKFISQKDGAVAEAIASGSDARKAKKLAHSSQAQSEEEAMAPEKKVELMFQIVRAKFFQNPVLADKLLQTKSFTLVEGTKDEFWGCGTSGTGTNHLGVILMTVRAELLAAKSKSK